MYTRVGRPPVSVYYECKIVMKKGEVLPISDILLLDLLEITEDPYSISHPFIDFKPEKEEVIEITEQIISKYKERLKLLPENSEIRKRAEEKLDLLKKGKTLIVRKIYRVDERYEEEVLKTMRKGPLLRF
jgi:DNA-binding transcriptional regulator GbsR (MarR family)